MPTITNVILDIQKGGALEKFSPRNVTVKFTANFNAVEILAGTVFKASVKLRSDDNDRILPIGSINLRAANTPVSASLSHTLTRANLDEDQDSILLNGQLSIDNRPDEWFANVMLSPVVFESATAESDRVNGSWGVRGED